MNSPELRVKWIPDDQWIGELEAVAISGDFAGKARAWFNVETIQIFIGALRKYPLNEGNPPVIEGSHCGGHRPQPDLRIGIGPHDALGLLRVQVHLANRLWTPGEQSVAAQFFTEYGLLANFAAELASMLDGKREIALLVGRDRI